MISGNARHIDPAVAVVLQNELQAFCEEMLVIYDEYFN